MKKRKKQPIQIDLWGNKQVSKKTRKKFAAFDLERELFIRMRNDKKISKTGENNQ